MLISGRWIVATVSLLAIVAGAVLWAQPQWLGPQVAAVLVIAGVVGLVIASLLRPSEQRGEEEADDIREISEARRRELIRGTSLFLREMRYRYSVRFDGAATPQRSGFTAEVNTVRLGFVPAVITDNTTDRQGYGYVAFVHDGRRWRGPGLPCPADETEAVRHAARCVSPLASEEETNFEGNGDR